MTYKRGQDGQVKRKALFYAPCAYLWKWANKGTSKGCLLAYLSFTCPPCQINTNPYIYYIFYLLAHLKSLL